MGIFVLLTKNYGNCCLFIGLERHCQLGDSYEESTQTFSIKNKKTATNYIHKYYLQITKQNYNNLKRDLIPLYMDFGLQMEGLHQVPITTTNSFGSLLQFIKFVVTITKHKTLLSNNRNHMLNNYIVLMRQHYHHPHNI